MRRAHQARSKLSTTIAPENFAYLESQVKSGRAATIAEAVDFTITRQRRLENRMKLAKATEDYFAGLSNEAADEENDLAFRLHQSARGIDFDSEL